MIYSYRAYGLGILSSTAIAGLQPCPPAVGSPDLYFQSGSEPDWALEGVKLPGHVLSHRPEFAAAPNPAFVLIEHGNGHCFQLCYSDGTRFVVDGKAQRVWGAFQPPLTPEDLATYFLGPVIGFLLRRRLVTCLHASAVELLGWGVAFCGDAGNGKSTTAAAFALRGLPVLSEDVVPLEEFSRGFNAIPGYPRVCLWPDAVAKLLGSEDALPRLTAAWDKCYLPLDGIRGKFSGEKLPLGMIYLFGSRSADEDAPRVEEIRPREALLELVRNTYMNWLLDREQRAVEFDFLARLVQQVTVRRIVPHQDPCRIAGLCEQIRQDAEKVLANRRPVGQSFLAARQTC